MNKNKQEDEPRSQEHKNMNSDYKNTRIQTKSIRTQTQIIRTVLKEFLFQNLYTFFHQKSIVNLNKKWVLCSSIKIKPKPSIKGVGATVKESFVGTIT